ncbi:MAG: nicotinate phosphoribosyltransferase [Lachnospiraceae bacterium]|nr:nicotinate phosphoribosyltransferase [Lachnospiraceae bacterium]
MKLDPIITSLLETDMYKFSMGQAIYHQFSDYKTTWTFKCRNKDVFFTHEMVEEIKDQIKHYCDLRFNEEELSYLDNITWIKGSYVDFLRLWKPRYKDFTIKEEGPCGLSIETFGTWLNTSMYEIPTLAIVNEVYFRMAHDYDKLIKSFKERLDKKVELLSKDLYRLSSFSEFGLRRRLSAEAQEMAVKALAACKITGSRFVGTSNVYLAMKYKLTPVGTMAHEWIMCVGQGNHRHNPAYSNWYALDAWVKEYGVLNGTALTDAITTECFLRDFRLTYSTLFSGVRHDSGDPIEWGERMIKHYESLNIDPKTKTLLFSDSLDFEKATAIFDHFNGRARVAFGIGTYIANDTDVPALNIVMKTTACNGMDVAKLSDVEGKGMCKNPEYIDYLQRCIDWRMKNEAVHNG